jgi:PAS domain S-box-containing protein
MPEPQKNILLVEDEVLIAMSEAELLKRNGYNTSVAHSGAAAIEKALGVEQFDLILMDINLGHGIDGTSAAREILSVKRIPVIFLSSHTEPEVVKKTAEITSLGYITKTSGEAVLLSSVRNAFKLIEAYNIIAERDRALVESEQLFRAAFDNSTVGMAYVTANGSFIRTNAKFRETFGYAEENIPELNFNGIISSAIDPEYSSSLYEFFKGSVDSFAAELMIKKSSRETNVNLSLSRPSTPDKNGFIIAIAENISARKEAESRLKKTESLYTLISENSDDVIWVFDPDTWKFTYVSPSVFRLRGCTPEEIIDQPLEKSVTPDSLKTIRKALKDMLRSGNKGVAEKTPAIQIDQPHKNGSVIHTEVVMNLVIDEERNVRNIIGVTRDIGFRYAAEKELKKNHLLLKRAQSIARLGYWEIRFDDMTMTASEEATHIYGVTTSIMPLSFAQQIPLPEYRALLDEKLGNLIDGKEPYDIEFRIRQHDTGAILDIHSIAQYDPSQNIVFGVIQDITELKLTQERLRISEERYRRITDIILDYIYSVKIENGQVTETIHTPGCFRVTGYTPEEFTADPYLWYKMVHDDDKPAVSAVLKEIFEGESVVSFSHRIVKRDGKSGWVKSTIVARKNERGTLLGYDGLVEDITERREMEEALRIGEKKYRDLVENMIDVHWQTDKNLHYTYISPTDKLQRGFESGEIIGHSVTEFMTPDSAAQITSLAAERRKRAEAGENIGSTHFIIQQRKKNGEIFWCEILSNPIYDPSGELSGFQGITRDINTRKLAEIALEKAVREKEELLRELNHRVKNSLSMITGLISLEKNQCGNAELKKAFEGLRSRVITIANLYATLDTKDNAEFIQLDRYLKTIADSIRSSYAPDSKKIVVETDFDEVSIDVKRAATLGLILNELLTNSLKYAFAGRDGKASISLKKKGNELILNVRDNGNGLPENFDIAEQRGIGMKLILMLSEQMEGSVTCESANGASFTINIPAEK